MQFSKLELNTLPCPFPVTVPDGRLPFVSDISQGDPLFSSTIQISEGQQYKQPPGWILGKWQGSEGSMSHLLFLHWKTHTGSSVWSSTRQEQGALLRAETSILD